jgi:general secretion pathway protein G
MSAARQRSRRNGFTLLELLVVMVILGLLAGIAAPQALKFLAGAKADTAKIQIQRLGGVLDLYRLEVGNYPPESSGLTALVERPSNADRWNGPYVKNRDMLVDPWGHPYLYRRASGSAGASIYSLGADGQVGGEGEDRDITGE